ncbi:MAG: amidohydrolase family protein [Myxococcales bacterium]
MSATSSRFARRSANRWKLDLEDATVVPGLVDSHGHLVMLGRAAHEVDLLGCSSAEELASLVGERARQVPKGQWIRGQGWDQNRFPGGEFPDRLALDAATPGHPVLLERVDGHAALVNAAALAMAGIGTGSGGDLPGGQILRDESGRPTGVLVDTAMEARGALHPAAQRRGAGGAARPGRTPLRLVRPGGRPRRGHGPGRHRGPAPAGRAGRARPSASTPWSAPVAPASPKPCRPGQARRGR